MGESRMQKSLFNTEQLKLFNTTHMDQDLLVTQPFIDALHLVEASCANPNLSVKFGQTCLAKLRSASLFDLRQCRRYIPEIFAHLVRVCQNINFELDDIREQWSTFTLCHRNKSKFDVITFDRATVTGARTCVDDDARARVTFFFYAKLLHELAHACLAELGRTLPTEDDDEQFTSSATHGLTGEAGNSIERHFFGSVVVGIGHYTDNTRSIYKIDHLILRENQKNPFIKHSYCQQLCLLNLSVIASIPVPETENRAINLIASKQSQIRSWTPKRPRSRYSPALDIFALLCFLSDIGISPKSVTMCTFFRTDVANLTEEPAEFDTDDQDDDQPIVNAAGKLRYPPILRKI